MNKKKVDILVGMQFGSEGKGLIAGHLGMSGAYDTAISTNMPNAGHTYIKDGKEYMFKVLPNSAVNPHIERIMIGPDAVFSEERLLEEIEMVGSHIWDRLIIHENAVPLKPEHVIAEEGLMETIGSTAQGSAAAMIHKICRQDDAVIRFDSEIFRDSVVSHEEWMDYLMESNRILLEGAQGYSLGLNAGFYPFCTSRDCTPTRLAAGACIPYTWIDEVFGAMRIHPIRVGGNSGPGYHDQRELTWEGIGIEPEFTTVTNRQRRVFTWSDAQAIAAIRECQPKKVFLNFCNYDPEYALGVKIKLNQLLELHGPLGGAKIAWTGWGPNDEDIHHEN